MTLSRLQQPLFLLAITATIPNTAMVESLDVKPLQQYVKASSLSYLSMEKMKQSPYLQELGYRPVHQVVDPLTESGATIFVSNDDHDNEFSSPSPKKKNKIVVACRGSATPKNFVTNLKFNFVDATVGNLDKKYGGKIHGGFQQASYGLWDQLESELQIVEQEMDTDSVDITFTGHSLGGATALLCAAHHATSSLNDNNDHHQQQQQQPKTSNIASNVVTFGGPRICNEVMASHLSNTVLKDCNILHVVHDQDPVLVNNEQLWDTMGFHVAGNEVQCDPYNPVLYRDDAEKEQNGSNGSSISSLLGAWNILDHCNYLGTFVGPRLIQQ